MHYISASTSKGVTTVYTICRNCRKEFRLTMSPQALKTWHAGTPIQDAISSLSPAERELLISGTCGTCFDKLFASEQ